MTIEEMIIKAAKQAIKEELTPKFKWLEREITALKAEKQKKEVEPKLLLVKEAAEKLKVTKPKIRELIKAGVLKTITPPGGRVKILEESLRNYIITGGME